MVFQKKGNRVFGFSSRCPETSRFSLSQVGRGPGSASALLFQHDDDPIPRIANEQPLSISGNVQTPPARRPKRLAMTSTASRSSPVGRSRNTCCRAGVEEACHASLRLVCFVVREVLSRPSFTEGMLSRWGPGYRPPFYPLNDGDALCIRASGRSCFSNGRSISARP